ncbi:MAG: rhodanese-like domain-containing protein [Alphaproteobacteria bacterium]|nr:MAG: rhodanese-like domain-containing protein [Alphaproteobacteria bacterium]
MQKLTYDQFTKTRTNPGTTVINVLTAEQYKQASIPGSTNIPWKDNPNFATTVEKTTGGKDKPTILYCASAACTASADAAKTLETKGFTKVSVYEGGMQEWTAKTTGTTTGTTTTGTKTGTTKTGKTQAA